MLSAGRVVAETDLATLGPRGSGALEAMFMQATGQPDYTPVARRILEAISS